jgi:DNA-binding transcriptional ArsR family regulator
MKSAPRTQEKGVTKRFGAAVSDVVGLSRNQNNSVSPETTLPGGDTESKSSAPGNTGGDDDDEDHEESDVEQSLPLDQVFEILKNSRRRETLHYLDENGGEASLSELAEHIAALENDTTVAAISSSQRKRVYVGLYQCHLPKMADMGIVEFNQNRGIVELGAAAPQLYQYLDNQSATERNWHKYYLSISVAGLLLFGLTVVATAGTGLIPLTALAGLCVAIATCSVAHTIDKESDDD